MRQHFIAHLIGLLLVPAAVLADLQHADPPPPTNPVQPELIPPDLVYDMNPNFDWRVPTYQINFGDGNGLVEVQSPFWVPIEGLQDLDYEPDDGWVLMAKHFGSATVVENTPFLILYNKYRAVVRYIAYVHSGLRGNYSWGMIRMRHADGPPPTKNLTNRAILQTLSHYQYSAPMSVIKLQDGWNYADFVVQYDPGVAAVPEPTFAFDVKGVTVSDLQLSGGGIIEPSTPVTDLEIHLDDVFKALVAGHNRAKADFKSTAEILNYLNKLAESNPEAHQEEMLGGIFASLGVAILGGATKALLPGLAAVVGFAESFRAALKKNEQPTVKSTLSLALTGNIRSEVLISTKLLRVPGANHNGMTNGLPIWDYPLGVFAILDNPATTYLTSNSAFHDYIVAHPCTGCSSYPGWLTEMDVLNLAGPVPYAVNGSFPGAYALRSVEAAWTFQAPFTKPNEAGLPWWEPELPEWYIDWMNDRLNAGLYVVIGSADAVGQKFYQYRTQYADIGQFHLYKPEVPRTFLLGEPYYTMDSGITPPVQVRVRFAKPGGTPLDDVIFVENYDLWYPSTDPIHTPNFNPPSVNPAWKNPSAPVQPVTSPVPGGFVPRGQPWTVTWGLAVGTITGVDVHLSSDNGLTFPTLLKSVNFNEGSLQVPAIQTTGTQYWVRVRTVNLTAVADAVSGPFTVWGVNQPSVAATAVGVCSAGSAKAQLSATWTTSVATNGPEMIEVTLPTGTYTGTKAISTATTSHSIVFLAPCTEGPISYRVGSTKDGGVSYSDSKTVAVNMCPECVGNCPGCRREGSEGVSGPIVYSLDAPGVIRRGGVVRFGIAESGHVRLDLFNVAGQRVARLVDEDMGPGVYARVWEGTTDSGRALEHGVYFARLEAGKQVLTKKIVYLR